MPQTEFQLVDNQTFLAADVGAGGLVFDSGEQSNGVGNDLSTGIYFIHAEVAEKMSEVRKIVLMK